MEYYNKLIKEKNKSTILLYGEIGDNSEVTCSDIVGEILQADAENKPLEIRINSNGGEVYSGIAIIAAILNCENDIKIFVDGVAASIASVIALCGKHVEMGKYSKIMIHRVSANCNGTTEDLKECITEIEDIEKTLCSIYSEKCKISPEEVRKRFFDGSDHWFTANEAFEMGLIDGIFENEKPTTNTPDGIYREFNNRYLSKNNANAFNTPFMGELCRLLGITAPTTENEILTALKRIIAQKDKEDANESLERAINRGLINKEQRTVYKALLKSNRTAFKNYLKDREREEKTAISNILDSAQRTGRIFSVERPLFENIALTMGVSTLMAVLKAKPKPLRAAKYYAEKEKWDLDDWRTYDPKTLENNPILLQKLLNGGNLNIEVKTLDWYRKNDPDYLKNNPGEYMRLLKQEYNKK